MTKFAFATAVAVALTSPALAQVIETPTTTTIIIPPGAPGVVTRQTNSTGAAGAITYSLTGRAEDGISNDSAAAGNEGQPSRIGSTGSAGGR